MTKFFQLILLCTTLIVVSKKRQVPNNKIVTPYVATFIHIFNTVDSANRIATFQFEYLDKGSDGLKDYATLRFDSAAGLIERIHGPPNFYEN
jgi:hypothetical protein